MIIALLIFIVIIVIIGIAGVISYYKLAVPNMKPLSEDERKICENIVKQVKAYPFVCKRPVKTGKCPCLPCEKLHKEKIKLNLSKNEVS